MKFNILWVAAVAAAGALALPAGAQMTNSMEPAMTSPPTASEHAMPTKPMKPMSASEQKKWDACMAMAPDMMMRDAKCMKMKNMHDDMAKNKGM